MERGKMSAGRGGKSKAPQHPQDIFALGSKSTVVVPRDSEKRNIHKPSTSGVERKRETPGFGSQPPSKRARIGSPAESVAGTSLDVEPVDLVPSVLQALDTHNSDKLLMLLTSSIRLLKSQRSKPDPILCMSMLYLTKIRPNMFAHEVVTQSLCQLLKREQGAAFKSKGNPLVFVLACNMLYAGHKDSNNWPDTFIKVYIEDALNERWWVDCSWCKCLVENIVTAFSTKQPPPHLIPSDNTLGTMSPSGSGSPLMGSADEDAELAELEYSVFPRYSSSYETVEALVLEAIKEQIQRRAAPDAIGKGFLKLLSATCGFPEIRMISASRLEAWLHSGKLWRNAQELLAHVCCNADAAGPTAARDHEVLAQLARMRLKTKPLQAAYQACLREMVADSPALLRSVVTHTIYNELSNVRSPNNISVLCALVQAQPQQVPAAMATTYQELVLRAEDYLRPLRALTRECVRAARAEAAMLVPLARALAQPPPHEPPQEVRERAFASLTDLFCCCCLVTASHSKHLPEYKQQVATIQGCAVGWLLDTAVPIYRAARHEYQQALNKIMFVESAEAYSKVDNWPPEAERALTHRLCCEAPLPQNTLHRLCFIGLSKDIPVMPAEVFELVEQLVRRACALPPEDTPLQVDKLEIAEYIFQLCQFNPPDNITLPAGYTPPPLAITSLYWRAWLVVLMLAAHNAHGFAERAAAAYPTLRALSETCITGKPSIEWNGAGSSAAEAERAESERALVLQLETHLASASNAKLPVTEHNSRLLSQLTTLDPPGPARKPPPSILETLQQLNTQLRLGKLLCRQPALLLELVERHGTRRAMPWLHHLLKHDQLELSVLPVQCLCEFLSAGGGGGSEAGKAGELCAHLQRTAQHSEAGARAVLHYYTQRLHHQHAPTRAGARRGLKLVLTQTAEDAAEMDYNADVSSEEWLDRLWELRHWAAVREEVVSRVRAACLAECAPGHVAAYLGFLARHVQAAPDHDHTDIVLDLSQLLMERPTVMGWVLPAAEAGAPPQPAQHRALHALTQIMYHHLYKVRSSGSESPADDRWPASERVSLVWSSGRQATLHVIVAHAHLKLLCYGPSMYDTNQEMYTWLQSVWVGNDAPQAFLMESSSEAVLLPDWLRLHLVRSARPQLLEAGLRGLPAHKLALFIQTFGMPVPAMSALLSALDACPAGAVVRLGVERGYMAQLLRVQRARGAQGGQAFAAALRLQHTAPPPDEALFEDEPLPLETASPWDTDAPWTPSMTVDDASSLLNTLFAGATSYNGDLDTGLTELLTLVTEGVKRMSLDPGYTCPYAQGVSTFLQAAQASPTGLHMRRTHAAPLLRALLPLDKTHVTELGAALGLFEHLESPHEAPPVLPPKPTKEQLIAAFEAATPNTLEALGTSVISHHDPDLVVDVICTLLQNKQQLRYETKVKSENEEEVPCHVFSQAGLGCGLLLDWLAELQRETHTDRQMRLMFGAGAALCAWRPQLVALLAHRASWRTLHACLATLLQQGPGSWEAGGVLQLAQTLCRSARLPAPASATHKRAPDTLGLTHAQLKVLVKYVIEEAEEAERSGGVDEARKRIEARLPLVLHCCRDARALLAIALPAAEAYPLFLMLLYMKVPKVAQLLQESLPRPRPLPAPRPLPGACAASTSATDTYSHALLTALVALCAQPHNKDTAHKIWRLEAGVRSVWARAWGAGGRALSLAGALLRGAPPHARHHHHVLAAIEVLPDQQLFSPTYRSEVNSILECFLSVARAQASTGARDGLAHRVAAVLRRYLATCPAAAQQLLTRHHHTVQSVPALSSLAGAGCVSGGAESASAAPPAHALRALQRRALPPADLAYMVQEIEAWGVRRGGAWGGARVAGGVLRAAAPLAASPHAPLRAATLGLLTKLLPAVPDTTPGLQAILECLDSSQPEITESALEKLPDMIVGMQEHAARLLMHVFQLGVASTHPVDTCIVKCVATLNLHRGC